MLGPIDYIVLGFSGNQFDGSIMRELSRAANSHIIRVLDLMFVIKDEHGDLIEGEYEEQSRDLQEALSDFRHEQDMPLLTRDDILKIGEQLEPDTSAAVLVIEHLWAKDLKKAIKKAGGFVVVDGRIHPDAAETAARGLEVVAK